MAVLMGSLDILREPVRFDDLVRGASAIALVRPADPPQVVEDRLAWHRYVVEEWLAPPLFGPAPAVIEVASADNEAAVRDANDEAAGLSGHVAHVVIERFLEDAQEGWDESPDGRRIVFLSPASTDEGSARFVEECRGVWVGPAARDAVRVRRTPPPAAPRPSRLPWVALGLALVALVVWRSRSGEPPVPEAVLAHFAGWDALVEATWKGDAERAALLARDLTGGPETDGATGAAADGIDTVGGALGFLGLAEDDAERIEALAVAARGCGQCHEALEVPEPPRPVWAHETAATWAVDAVVWDRPADPPPGDPPLDALAAAWSDPVAAEDPHTAPELRARRVLTACTGCHRPR